MHLKDYYGILELETSATQQEIKKAYRQLALRYHPDKNPGDAYATSQFTEIKEAYEVLTNPAKKENYLQQRWYNQSKGKRTMQKIITPVTVLKQSLELERYVSHLDVFRMDKEGLKKHILDLIPDEIIERLHTFNEPETNRQIISTLLKAISSLPHLYTTTISTQLKKLSRGDETAEQMITGFVQKKEIINRRDKYSLIIIIAITVIICMLIYLAGR